ncbi:MAG: hypothetical protein ACOC6Q_02470 [Patescibacteria group bacterium]
MDNENLEVKAEETIEIQETIGLALEKFGKKLVEIVKGYRPSGDKENHPKGVDIEMRIDIENDWYGQKVTDVATGKVTHKECEPLSEHNREKQKKYT